MKFSSAVYIKHSIMSATIIRIVQDDKILKLFTPKLTSLYTCFGECKKNLKIFVNYRLRQKHIEK